MRKSAGIAALAAAGLMAAGMAAPSAAAPSNKGTTFIKPSPITLSVLEGAAKPVTAMGDAVGFGIVGNPDKGIVKHVGGLILNEGSLKLRNFWIEGTNVSGIVNGSGRVDLFYVDGSDLRFTEAASNAIIGSDAIEDEVAGTLV